MNLTIKSTTNHQLWKIEEAGLGTVSMDEDGTPVSAYYKGPTYLPRKAMMNFNFVGIGLPLLYWQDVTNQLLLLSKNITESITCDSSLGGGCKLSASCGSFIEEKLWTISFKLKFADTDNYIIFPLAAFAVDRVTYCDL